MGATQTSINVLASPDWQATDNTLRRMLGIDLHLRREELKDALRDYEKAHKGNNLVGSKVYEFLRHVQNIVWKQLLALKVENPAEYEAWQRGERGHWSLETNNIAHGVLLRLSENERMARIRPEAGKDVKRRKNGVAALDDNLRRTVQNWRRKTTAQWQCQNGDMLEGFPFFLTWTRLNRAGQPDPNGRGNVIGQVNMRWIFGPEWADRTAENPVENEAVTEPATENISRIPQQLETAKEKKEEVRLPAAPEIGVRSPLEAAMDPDLTTAQQQEHPSGAFEEILGDKFFAPAAGPGGEAAARAAGLWRRLWLRVYAPLMTTGRIRFSADVPFDRPQFRSYVAGMAVTQLTRHLDRVRQSGETTLEAAEARLCAAIDAQAKYLHDNPETWILHPEKFLRMDRAHGTLLSALRVWVHEPENTPPTPSSDTPEDDPQRRIRLYNRLVALGAVLTHSGTFNRWYRRFGPEHIEAALKLLQERIGKRRAKGAAPGQEFNRREGGASAYFASLINRPQNPAIEHEAAKQRNDRTRKALVDAAIALENTPQRQRDEAWQTRWAELSRIGDAMKQDLDLRQSWMAMMNAYFGISSPNWSWPRNWALIHHVLQINQPG